jgi:MFS family permease
MRLKLLLPFLMLVLAALACDDVLYYDTVYIAGVEADPAQPGHARALVRQQVGFEPEFTLTDTVVETTDFGVTWSLSAADFEMAEPAYPLSWRGDTLVHDGQPLWEFPRAGFREFFYEWTDDGDNTVISTYRLYLGRAHNAAVGDVLVVSAGTEGVVFGRVPGSGTPGDWVLRQNLPGLRPLPLRFVNPLDVAGVIVAALLLPPLPLIHAYLLSRVWRYLMPARDAWRRALRLSLGFAALAAAAITLWVVQDAFDIRFVPMALVVGAVVAGVSTAVTAHYARAANGSGGAVWRATAAALVLSALVPLGVLAVWWLWWAVALVVLGYAALAWLARRHLRQNRLLDDPPTPAHHWRSDRMALEALAICVAIPVAIWAVFSSVLSQLSFSLRDFSVVLYVLVAGALIALVLRARFDRQGRTLHATLHPDAVYSPSGWVYPAIAAVGWVALSGVLSLALFVAQLAAANWFQSLMRP